MEPRRGGFRFRSSSKTMRFVSSLCFLLLIHGASSFYLPGVAPEDFVKGDELKVKVNKLTSIKTQLPYSFYSLPYCRPAKIVDSAENLGEVLRGDRIENSPYVFKMWEPETCKILCNVKFDAKTVKEFKEKIDDEYRVNMILDNLPLVVPRQRLDQELPTVYQLGYHVGLKGQYSGSKEEKYFIHNHLAFTVKYHRDLQTGSARIVGFEVKPLSVKHEYEGKWNDAKTRLTTCDASAKHLVVNSNTPQEVEENKEVIFTYDVEFQESEVKWASRWDTYLLMSDDQIHWFSIVNSLMIVLFLSGMVAMIMLRTLYRDISKYNELETQEEAQEETGWKLVHGDVFRPPANSDLLCVYVGTGVQFLGMALVTMMFAILGFLSPSNRGGLMTAMLLLYVFMGIFAGYAAARLYKMFKGTEWRKIALRTAVLFPGIVSAIFFVLNVLIWGQKSSGAVPFGTMFALVFLWFGISLPLVFVGSYIGFRKPAIDDPVKTNKIPRQIPEQAWYMNSAFSILIGGILPFGAVFIELFFILTSIWLNQFYYIFGFLFLVFIILLITCAEITVVLCYFQLCSEDYLWWWRSYLTSGSSALYLFLYATFYFFTKLEITKLVSGVLYFGYMLIASYAFFVLTGTIGFYACFWFTRLIYSSVKID
ncbi:transmembrane 9 superfamily member 8-like [Mercurialis annua]|uniref:transmembrane 9 superfamily member 8-like n=1 Tax=Mercurialis annua TaxID=3986 RepID=UPI00215E0C4C|nr:transmembrane 9 superfamily member 8-like [Mercurialis annua]